jgi:hypothetical protein
MGRNTLPRDRTAMVFRTETEATVLPLEIGAVADSVRFMEAAETQRASTAMDEAWAQVERVMALNKQRDACLTQFHDSLAHFATVDFWTPETIATEFNLVAAVLEQNEALATMNAGTTSPMSAALSVVSTLQPKELDGRSTAADAAHFAPAADRHAPIRRCFANILRKRQEAPVEFTLLMKGIEQLQQRVVPIEDRMNQSKFKLPLHVPFHVIAQLITRTLLPQPTGVSLEEWLKKEIKPRLDALYARYVALDGCVEPKAIYGQLEEEAAERKKFHEMSLDIIHKAVHVETSMREAFTTGQKNAVRQCDEALSYVRNAAKKVTDSSKSLVDEVEAIEAKGVKDANEAIEELEKDWKNVEFKVSKSRKNQETLVRQIRESMKALKAEQTKHELAMQEAIDVKLRLARVEEAKRQFVDACHARRAVLGDAHDACLFVNDVISDVAAEVKAGLTLCQQHVSRMLAEENFRKIRIATLPMHNARDWYRAMGDLARIRAHRRDEIRQRMEGSWQLEFLLGQEEQAHSAVLAEYETELTHIQTQWARLTSLLVDLEVHVPVLHQYDKDPVVLKMRQSFLAVEGIGKDRDMKEVHRRLQEADASGASSGGAGGQFALPPVPPTRGTKPKSGRNTVTGVRAVPATPTSGSEATNAAATSKSHQSTGAPSSSGSPAAMQLPPLGSPRATPAAVQPSPKPCDLD